MKRLAYSLLVLVMITSTGICLAAEQTLQELQAKAAKIKTGPVGDTETSVRAQMGEPKASRIDTRFDGGRELKFRKLYYGPNEEIIITINSEYGHVMGVK